MSGREGTHHSEIILHSLIITQPFWQCLQTVRHRQWTSVLGCSWDVFCKGLCTPPAPPPKDHSYLSHKKSLLKNKVLPSFVYNSGKQSSALYAGTVRWDVWTATPRWQNPALNPGVSQVLFEDTDVNSH